eukprot:4709042-Pleurochrysis_carterae.AAC.4
MGYMVAVVSLAPWAGGLKQLRPVRFWIGGHERRGDVCYQCVSSRRRGADRVRCACRAVCASSPLLCRVSDEREGGGEGDWRHRLGGGGVLARRVEQNGGAAHPRGDRVARHDCEPRAPWPAQPRQHQLHACVHERACTRALGKYNGHTYTRASAHVRKHVRILVHTSGHELAEPGTHIAAREPAVRSAIRRTVYSTEHLLTNMQHKLHCAKRVTRSCKRETDAPGRPRQPGHASLAIRP